MDKLKIAQEKMFKLENQMRKAISIIKEMEKKEEKHVEESKSRMFVLVAFLLGYFGNAVVIFGFAASEKSFTQGQLLIMTGIFFLLTIALSGYLFYKAGFHKSGAKKTRDEMKRLIILTEQLETYYKSSCDNYSKLFDERFALKPSKKPRRRNT